MKKKFLGIASLFLALGMIGCGEPKVNYGSDKTNHWEVDANGDEVADTKAKHTFEAYEGDAEHVASAATCEKGSVTFEKCTVCGYIKENAAKDALGHNLVAAPAATDKAATCEEDGKAHMKCDRPGCTHEEDKVITALGHKFKTESTGKTGVSKLSCENNCGYVAYEFDVSQAEGWNKATTKWNAKSTDASNNKVEAKWDVTGVVENGKYAIELEGLMSYGSHSDRYFYNQYETDTASQPDKQTEAPFRYFFKVNGGDPINPDTTKSWGELGYEGSDSSGSPKFARIVSEVTINGATSFSVFHGDIGYSMIVSKVRLVKIA